MSNNERAVTSRDLWPVEFSNVSSPEKELEFRSDGKVVRKDRWEWGIRKIASMFRFNDFEIIDVVNAVKSSMNMNDQALGLLVETNPQNMSMHDVKIGAWLSAALDDPTTCDSFKSDINSWLNQFKKIELNIAEKNLTRSNVSDD